MRALYRRQAKERLSTDRGDGGAGDDFFLAHAWMHARRSVSRMDRTKFTWKRSRGSSSIGPPLICHESQYRDVVRLDCAAAIRDRRSIASPSHRKSITLNSGFRHGISASIPVQFWVDRGRIPAAVRIRSLYCAARRAASGSRRTPGGFDPEGIRPPNPTRQSTWTARRQERVDGGALARHLR